jgi:hypothetical protein
MTQGDKIGFYTKDEISQVLGFTGNELRDRLRRDLKQEVDRALEKYFSGSLLFNLDMLRRVNMPHVVLRVKTVQYLLDNFRERFGDQEREYKHLLEKIGYKVGTGFGIDFIGFLLAIPKQMPINQETLVETWTTFDSSAEWGKLRAVTSSTDVISIGIEDSFLIRTYEKPKHQHCAFLKGYVRGVLDEVLLEWSHIVGNPPHNIPVAKVEVGQNLEKTHERMCVFENAIRPETLPKTRDAIFMAVQSYRQGDYVDAVEKTRIVIEYAIKESLKLPVAGHIKFSAALQPCAKYIKGFDLAPWTEVWNMSSKSHHILAQYTEDQAFDILFNGRRLSADLCLSPIPEEETTAARESIMRHNFYEEGREVTI